MNIPGVPQCHDEVCITCSDTAVAVTVLELLDDGLATVATGAGPEEVSIALVTAQVGDTILVHAGEAIAVIEPVNASQGDASYTVESLYPFLYAGPADTGALLAQAEQSTVAKIDEVIQLRAQVCAQSGDQLASCAQAAAERFAAGGRLLTFGNGGSATDAQQLAALFLHPADSLRPANGAHPRGGAVPLPAISLATDIAVVTSLANDVGVEVVFARQVAAFGRPVDIAVGLSTSGNSENLLRAFDEASRRGLMTIGIAGYDGGKMAELDSIDYLFVAPSTSIHRIQEAQTTIYHVLWELVVAHLSEVS